MCWLNVSFKILFFHFILLLSLPIFACGTTNNWMDAYDGVDSNNKWRDSMSKLEKLVMLRSCGGRTFINKTQQTRLLRILTDAMSHKKTIPNVRTENYDIRNKTNTYRGLIPFEGLIESIYRKYHCLQDAENSNTKVIKGKGISVYDYFGDYSCPGSKNIIMKVKANGGGKLRISPNGRVIARLSNNIKIKVVGETMEWFRIINPVSNGSHSVMIGFAHKSIVTNIN